MNTTAEQIRRGIGRDEMKEALDENSRHARYLQEFYFFSAETQKKILKELQEMAEN